MSKIFQFGEDVAGYNVRVLNEREIRAAAGILFVLMFVAIMNAALLGSFTLLKYAVVIFLTDILIRVFINPKFSPTLILGRLIVRKQVPEYVGAPQKRFAWIIGIILALTMFVLIVVSNTFSVITGIICMICLIFLFFETSFGICLGCKVYPWFSKKEVQYCPGEVCELKDRQEIRKTSMAQFFIVLAFIGYIVLAVMLFDNHFQQPPVELFSGKSLQEMQQQQEVN